MQYSLFTSFSTWSGAEKAYLYDDDENGTYSTSAAESQHVYNPLTVRVEMDLKGSMRDGFQLPLPNHARERLAKYGFNDSELTLKTNIEIATLSSGRSVPLPREEWPSSQKNALSTYRVTFELNDVDILFGSNEVKNNKLVIGCHINTTINGVSHTVKEYIDVLTANEKPLKVFNIFVVTVMMREIPHKYHGVRCTGLPVTPSYVTSVDGQRGKARYKRDNFTK